MSDKKAERVGLDTRVPSAASARVRIVRPAALTDFEKQCLEKVGWAEGAPVPANLPDMLKDVVSDPNAPDGTIKTVPLGRLSMEKKLEVQQAMQAATLAAAKEAEPRVQAHNPSVQAALDKFLEEGADEQEDLSPEDSAEDENDDPKTPKPSPTGIAADRICPRCGWDCSKHDMDEVTLAQKRVFLQATLGGVPFETVFNGFGGQLQVRFRTLSPEELALCIRQAQIDQENAVKEGATSGTAFMENFVAYRLCLQLRQLRSGEGVHEFPESALVWHKNAFRPPEPGKPTVMVEIRKAVYSAVIRTESMQRMLHQFSLRFNRLVSRLEDNFENENFWKETSSDN